MEHQPTAPLHFARYEDGAPPPALSHSILDLLCLNIPGGIIGGYISKGYPVYCVNDYMIQHLGYESFATFSRDIGGLLANGIHPDDLEAVDRQVGTLLSTGETYEVQYRMRRQDGHYIWVNDIGRTLTDAHGDAVCISAIRDITREVEDRIELEKREARYNGLFQSVPCGITRYVLEGDGRLRFIAANDEALRIFGYSSQDLLKRECWSVDELIAAHDRNRVSADLTQLSRLGDKLEFEYCVHKKDGSPCWILGTSEGVTDEQGQSIVQSVFLDVTTRKSSERRNRMSDALLRLALRGTTIGEFYYFPAEHRLTAPDRTCECYGCDPLYRDAPADFTTRFVHADDRPAITALFARVNAGADTASAECRTADGLHWNRLTLSVADRDAGGQPLTVVGLIEDLTDQKRVETEHSELSALNQDILHSLEDLFLGVYRIDLAAGTIRGIRIPQDAACYGLFREDQPYNPDMLARAYHPEEREDFTRDLSLDALRRQKAQGVRSFEGEYRRLINGEWLWVSRVVYLNHADFGEDSAIVVLTDVSDRRRQNDIIRALGRSYFSIGYIDLDRNTIDVMRSEDEAFSLLDGETGNNYSKFMRRYVQRFVHPDDQAVSSVFFSLSNLCGTLLGADDATELCHTFRKRDGAGYQWVQATIMPSDAPAALSRKATIGLRVVDDTLRHNLETKQLLEAALRRAENASAAKSDFLSKMSHDIRTPMNAIMGMTSLAAIHLNNPDRVRDCLNKIAISSQHLLGLINEVLDMSKIESGKLDLDLHESSLPEFVQNTLTLVRPSIEQKHQRLRVNPRLIEHERVICDALRLQQVLVNIISNACKYTPEGGEIRLGLSELPGPTPGYARYQFTCRDNGIGMDPNYLCHLFEPFSRAADSRVSAEHGTGLGMAIAQSLIQMMGGEIACESEPNHGTLFTVTVDLELAHMDQDELKRFKGLSVLIADDDSDSRESTCAILSSIGIKGESVRTGENAIERAAQAHEAGQDFFAILLDFAPSDMDGIKTVRAIRSRIGDAVPIILLSACDWSDVQEKAARQAGVVEFLSKPLFRSSLAYLFKRLAGEHGCAPSTDTAINQDALRGKRLLVAEDNLINQEIACEFLRMAGAEVETACNGREAVERFAASRSFYYDAILMDIRMPEMDGYTATQTIRSMRRADAGIIAILAMTADAFAEDVQRARSAGMNGHIAKPLDLAKLLRMLQLWT